MFSTDFRISWLYLVVSPEKTDEDRAMQHAPTALPHRHRLLRARLRTASNVDMLNASRRTDVVVARVLTFLSDQAAGISGWIR